MQKTGKYMDFVTPARRRAVPKAKPAISPKPAAKPAPAPVAKPAPKVVQTTTEVEFGVIEDYHPVTPAPQPVEKPVEAPDANQYVLGGRSPFLNSVVVDKRPLSGGAAQSFYHVRSTKNIYTKEEPISTPENQSPVTIISAPAPKGRSPLAVLLIIFLTIILGAAVGTLAFFLLPK